MAAICAGVFDMLQVSWWRRGLSASMAIGLRILGYSRHYGIPPSTYGRSDPFPFNHQFRHLPSYSHSVDKCGEPVFARLLFREWHLCLCSKRRNKAASLLSITDDVLRVILPVAHVYCVIHGLQQNLHCLYVRIVDVLFLFRYRRIE